MCGKYKHCALIDAVPDCPRSDGATSRARPAFHFVFAPLTDVRNFRPAKIKQPRRAYRDDQQCGACGLSMFETPEDAREMVRYLTKGHKRALPEDFGDSLARADLDPADGESTPPDEHGHYNFFEFARSNVPPKFTIVGTT